MRDLRAHPVRVKVWRVGFRWRYEWNPISFDLHNPTATPGSGEAWTRWGLERKAGRDVGSWLVGLATVEYGRDEFQMMLDIPQGD